MKIGQKVYIVPEDARQDPYEATIVSIGRKYIGVKRSDWQRSAEKFGIFDKHSALINGWDPEKNLFESKEQYEQHRELQAMHHELTLIIEQRVNELSLPKIQEIINIIKSS